MDLAETMKNIVAKGMQTEMGPPGGGSGYPGTPSSAGYVTEKMYMLLQAYLQNKGWNPSIELLQCFSEFKDASMIPSAAYLQMMASRIALDSQGRLVLRENGKIILPYEHFANAVMLKHMNGPHGLHLGLEGTVRAVMESYTIGRECFGMEKEFIIEVVQNCPNPACRYYKNQLELTQKMGHMAPTYIQENETTASLLRSSFPHNTDFQATLSSANPNTHMGGGSTADLAEMRGAGNQMNLQRPPSRPSLNIPHRPVSQEKKVATGKQHYESLIPNIPMSDHKLTDFLRTNLDNLDNLSGLGLGNLQGIGNANKDLLALHNGAWPLENEKGSRASSNSEGGQEKIVRAFAEVMKNMARMKACVRPAMCKPYGKQSEALQKSNQIQSIYHDLSFNIIFPLGLQIDSSYKLFIFYIIPYRCVMLLDIKYCVSLTMIFTSCQSFSIDENEMYMFCVGFVTALVDTIQLVQSLRSFLPPPHIPVSSCITFLFLASLSFEHVPAFFPRRFRIHPFGS